MTKEIVRREIRYAWHLPKNNQREDMHYIKELVHYSDGTKEPRAYLTQDFKRPVWVTKPAARNHKEKKEFEHKDNLICRTTTESDLAKTTAGLLGNPYLANNLDALKASPYIYGFDIPSTSLVKYTTLKKNDFIQSPYSVATLDIETDPRTDFIQMVTIAFGNYVHVSMMKRFVKNIPDPYSRVKAAIAKYLPEYTDKLELNISYHDEPISMLETIFADANRLAPDFLAVWNIDFDITKILDTIKRCNKNPIDIICDQDIPRHLRVCRYKKGSTKKVTASGVVKPVNPSLQWHTLICTAKFYMIDAMCTYRQLRMAKAEEPSYSLDAILQKELKKRKLKFSEADGYQQANWHIFMQERYPIEYIVYNIYDCLGVLELDAKTKDLSKQLPDFAGITEFMQFNRQSRKLTDALFLYGLESSRVIGTACPPPRQEEVLDDLPDTEEDDLNDDDDGEGDDLEEKVSDYKTLGLKGWIQLLPQNHLTNEGLRCLEDYPNVRTSIRGITCDFDARSSYPSCTQVANVSKETCVNEIIDVEGLSEDSFRQQNLSICLGNANMLEYFEVVFGLPSIEEVDRMIDQGLI